jgi:hypothetical protein
MDRNWIGKRILIAMGILSVAFVFMVLCIGSSFYDFFFGGGGTWFAPWTLEFVEEQFIGQLPHDAINISYTDKDAAHSYARLSFAAPPQSADRFTEQFCTNLFYEGYDPFNAIDSVDDETGHLIATQSYYYFSYSQNTPTTVFGNRCFQNSRGGLLQIRIDKSNPAYYLVDLEISGYCNNPLAPHPCDGQYFESRNKGTIRVNDAPVTIQPRRGVAMAWTAIVESSTTYQLQIVPEDTSSEQLSYVDINISPVVNAQTRPFDCDLCTYVNRNAIDGDGLHLTFEGSPTGETAIRLFWITDVQQTYEIYITDQ